MKVRARFVSISRKRARSRVQSRMRGRVGRREGYRRGGGVRYSRWVVVTYRSLAGVMEEGRKSFVH